jgi:hypothetical protein
MTQPRRTIRGRVLGQILIGLMYVALQHRHREPRSGVAIQGKAHRIASEANASSGATVVPV